MKGSSLIFFIFIYLIFSCEKRPVSQNGSPQIARINFLYTPFTLDPRKTTDPITTVTNHMLYEKLIRLNSDGTIEFALAERVEVSEDQKIYTFFLKKSVWSDGSPLTAHHFETGWKKALSPEFASHSAHLLFPIENAQEAKEGKCPLDAIGINAINDHTLMVKLKHPTPYFLKLISHPVYSPIPYDGNEIPYPRSSETIAILTNGPFKIKSWKNDNELIAIKNPHYWNASQVRLEKIHASIISDEATAFKLFKLKKLDYIGGIISPLPLEAISQLKKKGQLYKKPLAGTTLAFFNIHQFPFHNLNIRKAFALAINKKEIVEHVTQMFDDPARGPIPPVFKKTDELPPSNDYDPKAALTHFEKGLQELGISKKKFPLITYSLYYSELQHQLALAIQGQWQQVLGISVQLKTTDLKSHLHHLHSHQFEIIQMSWIAQYDDPLAFLERFINESSHCNYSRWENPLYKHLIEASFYQEGENRDFLLNQAEQVIQNDMPNIPLYHYYFIYLKQKELKGLSISVLGDIQFHKAYIDSS